MQANESNRNEKEWEKLRKRYQLFTNNRTVADSDEVGLQV